MNQKIVYAETYKEFNEISSTGPDHMVAIYDAGLKIFVIRRPGNFSAGKLQTVWQISNYNDHLECFVYDKQTTLDKMSEFIKDNYPDDFEFIVWNPEITRPGYVATKEGLSED